MKLPLRPVRGVIALAALAALGAARANHFILPCGEDCNPHWVLTGSLNVAREAHTATLLPDGKVLVTGGFDANGTRLASAELYDPATGAWSVISSMATPRAWHFAFPLSTGSVLVVGGEPCCSSNVTVETYDFETG